MLQHPLARVIIGAALLAVAAATGETSPAAADPLPNLAAAVDEFRGTSQCAPLTPDPLVTRGAEMALQATNDYITHRSAAVPFTDPMPALKTIGYTGSKAQLFSGYAEGNDDSAAIKGLILQGRNAIRDCTYTQYGVSAVHEDGYVLTSVVLTVP